MALILDNNTVDCVFLVGPEFGERELVCGIKNKLEVASPYFKGLFRSPFCLPSPIRIPDVPLKYFKKVFEFIHLGHIQTQLDCKELLELLCVSDFYLIDSLRDWCVQKMESIATGSDVWAILGELLKLGHLKKAADLCISLLRNQTEECLNHASFLTTPAECVTLLLEQDTLNLTDECQLIRHCVDWAKLRKNFRTEFKELLVNLRVLTLSTRQVECLPPDIFTPCELHFIWATCSKTPTQRPAPQTLCPNTVPRHFRRSLKRKRLNDAGYYEEHSLVLVSQSLCGKEVDALQKHDKFTPRYSFYNKLHITPKYDLHVARFCFLPQIETSVPLVAGLFDEGYMDEPSHGELRVTIYKNGSNFQNFVTDISYHQSSVFSMRKTDILNKGEEVVYEFKFSSSTPITFRNIQCEEANASINRSLDTDVFESVYFSVTEEVPIVVEQIKYAFVH